MKNEEPQSKRSKSIDALSRPAYEEVPAENYGNRDYEMMTYREPTQDLLDGMSPHRPEPSPMLREIDDNIREYQQMEKLILGNLSAQASKLTVPALKLPSTVGSLAQ